jgi:colicin import membrane protein
MNVAAGALLQQEPGKVPSVVLALLVHLVLAALLFFGVHWQSRQPEAVMVEMWSSLPAPVVEKPPPKPEIKPAPAPKPESKPEPKPEPKVEKAIEPRKPDIALEKKKEIKKEPPKKVEPAAKKPEPEPKKPEPKLKFDHSTDLRAQADREMADVRTNLEKDRILDQMRGEAAAAAAKADAAYIGKLIGAIRRNIVLPPDIAGNPEAIFDVVQLPTGEVMSVKLRKSSGHKAYDAAVERAILKSSPLPKPDRPEQYQRNLEIKFRPLD